MELAVSVISSRAQKFGEYVVGVRSANKLSDGKTQYPYDVSLQRRRFRVYGTTIFAVSVSASRIIPCRWALPDPVIY